MPQKKRTERINSTIDVVLKRQFEAVCALKGLSMSDGIQDALSLWLKENASSELLNAIKNESKETSPASNTSSGKGKGKKGGEE
jgi:dsDNA-binding SOS-regulon protein